MTSVEQDLDPSDGPTRSSGGGNGRLIITAVVVSVIVAVTALGITQVVATRNRPVTHRFVVPAGTASRVAKGEKIEILPTDLEVRVGDRLVVKNEDFADFGVGPYMVRSGETLQQTFQRPGAVTGECGLTLTNEIRIFIS